MKHTNEYYMRQALKQAQLAYRQDEVPVGAVIVLDGKIIARGHNCKEKSQIATRHAEMVVIEKACRKIGNWHLNQCEMYVTLEPCPMCAGACIQSRIKTVYCGTRDPKSGSVSSVVGLFTLKEYNHHPDFAMDILQEECSGILKDYFKHKRKAGS